MAKLILIAAVGKNRELGQNNDLIWHLKKDMQFFKNQTINHPVVMGYNTFISLKKPLANRENIVLTHRNINIPGVTIFNDINLLKEYLNKSQDIVYIIGGAAIYKLFIDCADILLLTEIDADCLTADKYFPDFDKDDYQEEILNEDNEEGINYKHIKYIRK